MRILLSPVAYRTGRNAGAATCGGFTLIELIVTISILTVMSVLAAPYLRVPSTAKLYKDSASVADMFRYARDISIATGQPRGVAVDTNSITGWVILSILRDDDGTTVIEEHPVKHDPYVLYLPAVPSRRPSLTQVEFLFDNGGCHGNVEHVVVFDGHGIPRCVDPHDVLLESADLTIGLDGKEVVVSIDSITGRVTES